MIVRTITTGGFNTLQRAAKMDGCVALSFAVLAAIKNGKPSLFSECPREP